MLSIIQPFDEEAKFAIGQLVDVDLKDVPMDDRDATRGVITEIHVRFPRSPDMRTIEYLVEFQGNYIKTSRSFTSSGIPEIRTGAGNMTAVKLEADV